MCRKGEVKKYTGCWMLSIRIFHINRKPKVCENYNSAFGLSKALHKQKLGPMQIE